MVHSALLHLPLDCAIECKWLAGNSITHIYPVPGPGWIPLSSSHCLCCTCTFTYPQQHGPHYFFEFTEQRSLGIFCFVDPYFTYMCVSVQLSPIVLTGCSLSYWYVIPVPDSRKWEIDVERRKGPLVHGSQHCGLAAAHVYAVEQLLLELVTEGAHSYVKMKG